MRGGRKNGKRKRREQNSNGEIKKIERERGYNSKRKKIRKEKRKIMK